MTDGSERHAHHSPADQLLAALFTFVTLVAFAANSILCRTALSSQSIGPLEFTIVRLASGALILLPVLAPSRFLPGSRSVAGSAATPLPRFWAGTAPSVFLFGYALCFSLAYTHLKASVGALILFAAVQLTMLGGSLYLGNRVTARQWTGFGVSFSGLVYLLLPGLSAPAPAGTALMMIAGACWGIYSLMGRAQPRPVVATARNFLFCIPGCIILAAVLLIARTSGQLEISSKGILLGIFSGALASGFGYIMWYISLRRISVTTASIAQLSVPVLAGAGGVLFLNERLSVRLIVSALLILGGIVVAISGRISRK